MNTKLTINNKINSKEQTIKKLKIKAKECMKQLKNIEDQLNKEKEELKILKNKQYKLYDKLHVGDMLVFKDKKDAKIEVMIICSDDKYVDGLCLTKSEEYVQYSTFDYTFYHIGSLIQQIEEDMAWKLVDIKYQNK